MYDDLWEEAQKKRIEWLNWCCRKVDPRDLCHCTILEFSQRPLFWQFVCRGVVISQFEIKVAGIA